MILLKFKKTTPNTFHFYTEKLRQIKIFKNSDSALTHGWISGPWVQVWKPLQLAIDKCYLLRFSDSGSLKVDKTSYCGQYTLSCLYCLTRHKYSFMENTKHINFLGCLTGGSMWPILRDRDGERKFLPTTCQLCASSVLVVLYSFSSPPPAPDFSFTLQITQWIRFIIFILKMWRG